MEPITSWSEERVSEWLQGLDTPLHQYSVSEWRLSGVDLLQLTSQELEKLGVHKIGHQELLLEAVEKLCSLTYGIGGETLRGLTEKLRAVAQTLQTGIQGRWRLKNYDGQSTTKMPATVLQVVVELITSAKGLFSLLNRYQLFHLSGCSTSKNIFTYCRELGEIVHKDTSVYEKEKDIISVCRQLVSVCDEILSSSPEALLTHSAELESVDLVPASPGDQLGIEITSTSSSNHYVTGTAAEPSNDIYLKILAGDEVIQVNDQVVVGWSRANLVKKLQENPSGVTLVLKKIPGLVRRRDRQRSSTQKEEEDEEKYEESLRHSIFDRVAASVRSLSFRKAVHGPEIHKQHIGQEDSELALGKDREGCQKQQGLLSPSSASGEFEQGFDSSRLSPRLRRDRSPSPRSHSPQRLGSLRSPSPQIVNQETASISSCPEMVGDTGDKDTNRSSTKGMSRRRVSCRELGRPDCDGWLWKKRKESSVFITQKWQRFWFILKGPSLYWYTSQQDEKAEGLVNIASYSIESAGEHKRKYVFQMCHQRFQNFIFAADNVTDMSKWINCLITAIQKYKKLHKGPDSEEECYSETDSESERSPSPRRQNKKVQSNTLPRPKTKAAKMPLSPPPGGSKGAGAASEDEMSMMLNNIKEGGVSLIGHEQPLTHDHFRKSFIRRNKNPIINEKAHTLRALQSTLKAKEAELQLINKILEDSNLTVSKYRKWKEQNEELVQEIEKLTSSKTSKGGDKAAPQDMPAVKVAAETVAKETATTETKGAYRLSLSDGEQLVDPEPSDVLVEIPRGSPSPENSPVLELSLGSLQDSINRQLSEMAESGEATEHYFFI
ncbi:connector enhancer of kinase suppressor of ras 1 isoform X2 [Mastacembelus armatus]|uniref:connector enhancer of kinase suppressor of ras 1 isoform X2 n=1 Tax=Mastacembelus armatus TaxID=205130 RepID=UPI000E458CE6|nr:connector enhancer of kinase suppressor of ras 1 isoform X2 [Mastacembelus armatus]